MSAPPGKDGAASRPLGPDGKPIPGPAEVRQIQAARKMAQQQAQVSAAARVTARILQFLHQYTIFKALQLTNVWNLCLG